MALYWLFNWAFINAHADNISLELLYMELHEKIN